MFLIDFDDYVGGVVWGIVINVEYWCWCGIMLFVGDCDGGWFIG